VAEVSLPADSETENAPAKRLSKLYAPHNRTSSSVSRCRTGRLNWSPFTGAGSLRSVHRASLLDEVDVSGTYFPAGTQRLERRFSNLSRNGRPAKRQHECTPNLVRMRRMVHDDQLESHVARGWGRWNSSVVLRCNGPLTLLTSAHSCFLAEPVLSNRFLRRVAFHRDLSDGG